MKIKFLGAAREVTGSKHLIVTKQGVKILLDCGMYQGKGLATDGMNRKLGFNPEQIDHVILSHAHIDHSGLIPYMYKEGFRGTVVCTHATRDLCTYMLPDSGQIQEQDIITFNKKRAKDNLPPMEPLYTKDEAMDCLRLFIGVPYDLKFQINANIKVKFTNTGHMLGGGVINLEIKEESRTLKLAYTGDIGRPVNRILRSPDKFPQADFLIAESTYGDRLHEGIDRADDDLLKVVKHTCVEKQGKLIIPSFSVGRTQEIVYSLHKLSDAGKLPKIDIYVDSPLSVNATDVYRRHPECFNKEICAMMENHEDPFGFNRLNYIRTQQESKKLNSVTKPCIIIAASGMMEAGRIKHHLANNISNPVNTVLVVGYCSPETLGAKILRGDKEVSIHGQRYEVKAAIHRIESFSGHGDYREMIDFLKCQDPTKLQQMFIVHGDYEPQQTYAKALSGEGYKNIHIPAVGDEFEF